MDYHFYIGHSNIFFRNKIVLVNKEYISDDKRDLIISKNNTVTIKEKATSRNDESGFTVKYDYHSLFIPYEYLDIEEISSDINLILNQYKSSILEKLNLILGEKYIDEKSFETLSFIEQELDNEIYRLNNCDSEYYKFFGTRYNEISDDHPLIDLQIVKNFFGYFIHNFGNTHKYFLKFKDVARRHQKPGSIRYYDTLEKVEKRADEIYGFFSHPKK